MNTSSFPLAALAAVFACTGLHAQVVTRPLVVVSTKIVSLPADSAALKELGLTFDSAEGLSNLGVVPAAKVASMLTKIEKSPGVTLISAPSVTTKSGIRATGESARELIYPTKFDAAGINNSKAVQLAPGQIAAATPSTPLQFQMRRFGVSIEFEPTLREDNTTIELTLSPELVTFEGFINYGSPVKAAASGQGGNLSEATLTDNQIPQPVFAVFKTTTSATIPSGHCLILGGGGAPLGAAPGNGQKPDLAQSLTTAVTKPASFVFFFIQAKAMTP